MEPTAIGPSITRHRAQACPSYPARRDQLDSPAAYVLAKGVLLDNCMLTSLASSHLLPLQVVTNSIAGETYVLSQCGAQVPPASQFPEGTKFYTVPLASLSAPDTVPYAFIVRGRVAA